MQPEALADIVLDVLRPLAARLTALEGRAAGDLTGETIATLRERLAVLETRAPVPGPPGADGLHGKDGADGLGFDDLDLVIDDARKGCFLRFLRGDQVKEFRLPTPFDVGPYRNGEKYEKGNVVSWDGSSWTAKAQTTDRPGDGATAWRLAVKRGERGK